MIKKIISGGQTGSDRAALDFAIRHKIPHGGRVPKGRLAEDGRISAKYKLWQMPTDSYQKRTEQNVIDADGTLIISHGRLTGGSAYTRTMARKHDKPHLHLDLDNTDVFQASLLLLDWIDKNGIKILNVAGPRASQDPKIYEAITDLLENALFLLFKREELRGNPKIKGPIKTKSLKRPATVEQAVDRLISELSLRDRTKLANMESKDLIGLHFTLGMYIRNEFVYPRNDKLLESCREISKDKYLHWAQMHMFIIKQLWLRLRETHKLKVVSQT